MPSPASRPVPPGAFNSSSGIDRQGESRVHGHALRAQGADLVTRDLRRLLLPGGDGLKDARQTAACLGPHRPKSASALRPVRPRSFSTSTGPCHRSSGITAMPRFPMKPARRLHGWLSGRPSRSSAAATLPTCATGVGIDGVIYAGSHGFDIAGPGGMTERPEEARGFEEPIERAEADLHDALSGIEGARIERKTFAIAVHFREASGEDVARIENAVDDVAGPSTRGLRKGPRQEGDRDPAARRLGQGPRRRLVAGTYRDGTGRRAAGLSRRRPHGWKTPSPRSARRAFWSPCAAGRASTLADYALADPGERAPLHPTGSPNRMRPLPTEAHMSRRLVHALRRLRARSRRASRNPLRARERLYRLARRSPRRGGRTTCIIPAPISPADMIASPRRWTSTGSRTKTPRQPAELAAARHADRRRAMDPADDVEYLDYRQEFDLRAGVLTRQPAVSRRRTAA